VEARFHAEPDGLPGVLAGRVTAEDFADNMRRRWWQRIDSSGREAGLDQFVSRDTFDAALADFESAVGRDRVHAAADLVRRLLDGVAHAEEKPGWAEMTPHTALNATSLRRMFPRMRVVHALRDGRDVAASLARLWGWELGPALEWWMRRVRRIQLEQRALPAETMWTIRLERLVVTDRDRSYAALLDFLGLEDDAGMRRYFEEHISPSRMRAGAWREGLSADESRRFSARYREILAELDADGADWASDLAATA
jgi:hypothetical protein